MTAIDQSGLYDLKDRLLESPNVECLEHGIRLLDEYCSRAHACQLHQAGDGAHMLRQLLELAMSCQYDSADEAMWRPMTEFSAQHCETLGQLFEKAAENEDIGELCDTVEYFCRHSHETWGEYLQLLTDDSEYEYQWTQEATKSESTSEESGTPGDEPVSTKQIDQLLSALNLGDEADGNPTSDDPSEAEQCNAHVVDYMEFTANQEIQSSENHDDGNGEFHRDAQSDEPQLSRTQEFRCSEKTVLLSEIVDGFEGDPSENEQTDFASSDDNEEPAFQLDSESGCCDVTESEASEISCETESGDDSQAQSARLEATLLDDSDNDPSHDENEFSDIENQCDPHQDAPEWDEQSAWDEAEDYNSIEESEHADESEESPEKVDVSELLQGLFQGNAEVEVDGVQDNESGVEFDDSEVGSNQEDELFQDSQATESQGAMEESDWLPADQLENVASDFEIRDAYLEDAVRCLDQMEKCSLEFEESHDKEETVRLFCRELHTLKGASASVGLTNLASVIHDKETVLQNTNDLSDDDLTDLLLDSVDKMRSVIERIQSGGQDEAQEEAKSDDGATGSKSANTTHRPTRPSRPTVSVSSASSSTSEDALIRIRASKLDRLMDMLAELVVLRNRRESSLIEFNDCNKELTRCAARLSVCQNTRINREDDEEQANAMGGQLQEIARDVSVVASNIRDLQKPVGNDNLSISHFIRDFRQELMQLRRVPTEGLFNRLQRSARDVAKLEEKQMKLNFIGGETGIEQELQEKLYEPLLHIVRNAVSHGLEMPEDRLKKGKPEHGTITLKAQTNSQILVIEISDDGKGLDYEAIRKRGTERGLIKSSDRLSNDELAHLIFHPGFSTRDEATQVSGRGVGMDIVSTTLEQMRGRIDIESEANVGTTMRMIVPLRSAIEHVMVFKASNQLFALPTQAVVSVNRASEFQRTDLVMHAFSDLLSMPSTDCQDIVLLRTNSQDTSESGSIGLRVQEILGPEEVVMRNLPGLVDNHPLFSGLTLSGAGDTVLLLDSDTLGDYATQYQSVTEETSNFDTKAQSSARKIVLVVDDSLSARKMLVRKLSALGIDTQEAGDGVEALDVLRQNKFDLVLTDLDMPRLGGMELLFDLQKRDRYDTPVVVVTSRSQEQFRQQAIDRGAADYLTKPVSDEALSGVLASLNIISS